MNHKKLFLVGLSITATAAVLALLVVYLFMLAVTRPWFALVGTVIALAYPTGLVYGWWTGEMKKEKEVRDE